MKQEGLVWALGEPEDLGTTPLKDVPVNAGSYVLTLEHEETAPTTLPVHVLRGALWTTGTEPIPLYSAEVIGDGFRYVPAGPGVQGGDPLSADGGRRSEPWVPGFFISEHPVTMAEYAEFLDAVHSENPDDAWARVPRVELGLGTAGGQLWERPADGAHYQVPVVGRDGDPWDPRWAAMGISWLDAVAYLRWRSERDGTRYGLPFELQWEKAARGVDGRLFPWGDVFDPSLCKMRYSRAGRPRPEPVGAFATDRSVYGVGDLSGGVQEWCGDPEFRGDNSLRPVRGGAGTWRSATAASPIDSPVPRGRRHHLIPPRPQPAHRLLTGRQPTSPSVGGCVGLRLLDSARA